MDPTTQFELITFEDVRTTRFSSGRISRSALRNRILFARTNRGNFAKFQVQAGDTLRISRLVVYDRNGCVIKAAANINIRSSFSCDLDEGRETSRGADFWWHGVSPGVHYLEPRNRAVFAAIDGFNQVSFDDVRTAIFRRRAVERSALRDQVLYCRTSRGRFAKLSVKAGDTLRVSRLVVYDPATGRVVLNRSNIDVPRTSTLDVDTGRVGSSGYDLHWRARSRTRFELTPANGAAISYESAFQYAKYARLLERGAIRNALIYEDDAGALPYSSWPQERRLQLGEYLFARETGEQLPIQGPPSLTADRYMSRCDALSIYLAHVAQSLWAEAKRRVSWRLSSASPEHLEHLFDSRKLFAFSGSNGHSFSHWVMGNGIHWSPEISYQFLVDEGIKRNTPEATLEALTDWIRANLIHITGYRYDNRGGPFATQSDQYEYLYGYRGGPLIDKIIHPLPDRRRITAGCWGTDAFFAAVLRTINIPVRHGRSDFSGNNHSRPEFFTMDRFLPHGDDPYNGWVRVGHNNVPIARLFWSGADIAAEIDNPAALPGMTQGETASHNKSKFMIGLAVEFKTNYLLRKVCQDMRSGSTGAGSGLWSDLNAFYSNAQIETIRADCQAEIDTIPGGCSAF